MSSTALAQEGIACLSVKGFHCNCYSQAITPQAALFELKVHRQVFMSGHDPVAGNDLTPSNCQALALQQCCCVPSSALLFSLDKGCDAESNAHHSNCQGHGNEGFAQHSLPRWQHISHQLLQRSASLTSLSLARTPVTQQYAGACNHKTACNAAD
jgi:hypothetical protein